MVKRPGYDVRQVCLNGHEINVFAASKPHRNKKGCDICGEPTIIACTHCQEPIQGALLSTGHIQPNKPTRFPHYCHNCLKPFPWTERRIQAAIELLVEEDPDNAETIEQDINDLAKDSPRTPVAVHRLKQMVDKLAKGTRDFAYKLLVDVASETAKKMLTP